MSNKGDTAVKVIKTFLGSLYLWGGAGPKRVDCSGLGYYAWNKAGVNITRTTYTQVYEGVHVSRPNVRPGDGIYLRWNNGRPEHVIWAVSKTKAIHAPGRGKLVQWCDIDAKIAASNRYEIRRFAPYSDGAPDNRPTIKVVNLRVGKKGATVAQWKRTLVHQKCLAPKHAKGRTFDLWTWTATRSFQKKVGLPRMTGRQVSKATVNKAGYRAV